MTDEDERTVVKTYVPRSQKEAWVDHAESLDMSQSEFLRTMVQAGRRGFDPAPEEDRSRDTTPGGEGLEEQVRSALAESGVLGWEEVVARVSGDVERAVDDALGRLQDRGEVRYSGRDGGYALTDEPRGDRERTPDDRDRYDDQGRRADERPHDGRHRRDSRRADDGAPRPRGESTDEQHTRRRDRAQRPPETDHQRTDRVAERRGPDRRHERRDDGWQGDPPAERRRDDGREYRRRDDRWDDDRQPPRDREHGSGRGPSPSSRRDRRTDRPRSQSGDRPPNREDDRPPIEALREARESLDGDDSRRDGRSERRDGERDDRVTDERRADEY